MADKDWIVCQIGAREHYSVARALKRLGRLRLLVTDAWVSPGQPIGAISQKLGERYDSELEGAEIASANWTLFAREVVNRLTRASGWAPTITRNDWFQRMAVSRLRLPTDEKQRFTVFAYSYAARDIFEYAKVRGWRTILGQIDPGPFEEQIVQRLHESAGLAVSWKPPPREYWVRWNQECALADRIVVHSEWSRRALIEEKCVPERIRVVPLAFEPPPASPTFVREYPARFDHERPMRVLFLGQINLRKGAGPLFNAIGMVRDQPIEFWFVGPILTPVPNYLVSSHRVKWLGAVPRGRTSEFYQKADVFVFPTFSDGFGLTQLEAQAWRLPVVASRNCGNVVVDGQNGLILGEISSEAVADALGKLARDPRLLRKMAANSYVDDRFTLEATARRLLEMD